ncbi:MAG: hypothetical protein HY744_02640, partial [Deltaproteobacteria bacterium]|nr:hypothetical protein [Deltaproteobacteria bacterium]
MAAVEELTPVPSAAAPDAAKAMRRAAAHPGPGRRQRWARLAAAVAVLGLSCVVVEGALWLLDGRAFQHINCYVADAKLGARLRPGATQRLALLGGPVTEIRIGRRGLRGPPLGPAAKDEILVVGDSQVFGLGVEEEQTLCAALARELGRPVVNAGVPTFGPREYSRLAEELLRDRHADVVVLAVDLADDFSDAERAYAERYAIWDGWAVRADAAPETALLFPGRELLFRRSHAVLALRRWLGSFENAVAESGYRAGRFEQELLDGVAALQAERARAKAETARRYALVRDELGYARDAALAATLH